MSIQSAKIQTANQPAKPSQTTPFAGREFRESPTTEKPVGEFIDDTTGKIPPVSFLALAVGSIALSAGLAIFSERKQFASFVGLWAPTFMLFGIYNKLQQLERGGGTSTQGARTHRAFREAS
jgi:hypothetical protein